MPDPREKADRQATPAARAGLGQAIAEQFSLQAMIGGPRGLAESILGKRVEVD